jgi:hypothetical protein
MSDGLPQQAICSKCGLTPGFVRWRSRKPYARSTSAGLSERQRVRNHSELRLLAYPNLVAANG